MRFPPTVIITRSGSDFCGLNLATTQAYVTVLPWGTCDFFMNSIVSVPVFVLVPTPLASRPNLILYTLSPKYFRYQIFN